MDYTKISEKLDKLIANVDLSGITEEGVRSKLPDGFYLSQVVKAELTESKSGNPMVVIEYVTVEDGKKTIVDENGYAKQVDAKHTADKKIFCNYVLTNDMNFGFFVSDMLKFQDPETNEPFFTKEDFDSTQGIIDVCDKLTQGGIVYLMLQTVQKDNGESDQKKNPISWTRAHKFDLI